MYCGDHYTPSEDESPETKICDECNEMYGEGQEQFDEFSDADPGL